MRVFAIRVMLSTLSAVALLVMAGAGTSGPLKAAETAGYMSSEKKAAFEDIEFDLKDAIVNRGLKIDYVGHVGAMLARTGEAVGDVKDKKVESPYRKAKYYQFCSAKLTHAAAAANPINLAICPYLIFAYELKAKPGVTVVGYRRPIGADGAESQKAVADIEALLKAIVSDVTK